MGIRALLRSAAWCAVLLAPVLLFAEDAKPLEIFARRLDAVERKFWRVALLPADHRERPDFNSELHELENLARAVSRSCTGYDKKAGARPELYADCVQMSRVYNQFSLDSRTKNRRINLAGTGMRDYRRRHSKHVRDCQKEGTADGKKGVPSGGKGIPQLYQVDGDDYSDFLDETADKNSRKFSSWTKNIKSREKVKTAEELFSIWQKSVCDMRAKLVKLAQNGTFKKEIQSNGSSNNRR